MSEPCRTSWRTKITAVKVEFQSEGFDFGHRLDLQAAFPAVLHDQTDIGRLHAHAEELHQVFVLHLFHLSSKNGPHLMITSQESHISKKMKNLTTENSLMIDGFWKLLVSGFMMYLIAT